MIVLEDSLTFLLNILHEPLELEDEEHLEDMVSSFMEPSQEWPHYLSLDFECDFPLMPNSWIFYFSNLRSYYFRVLLQHLESFLRVFDFC